jgi:hypothetical protein
VRQHGEEGAGEEPGDDGLAQDRQAPLHHRLGMRRLARRRQPEGGEEQDREHTGAQQRKALRPRPPRGRSRCGGRPRRSRPSPRAGPAVAGRCRPGPRG